MFSEAEGQKTDGQSGQSENETAQFKVWVDRNCILDLYKFSQCLVKKKIYLKAWPLCEDTISICICIYNTIICIFDFIMQAELT